MGFDPGKKIIDLNGYPALSINRKNKYVHRLVAEHYFGVALDRSTFVHHKNEDRKDFRLANLEICTHGEHNGKHRRAGALNHFFGRRHSVASKEKIARFAAGRSLGRRANGTFMKGGEAPC